MAVGVSGGRYIWRSVSVAVGISGGRYEWRSVLVEVGISGGKVVKVPCYKSEGRWFDLDVL